MNAAVIGTSRKENEKRVAIHPQHLAGIPEKVRTHLFFEKGYGTPFGITDQQISEITGNDPKDRKTLLQTHKAVIIPKPVKEDFQEMQEEAVVWGWIHSIQQSDITQIAIDKKMTLICWENMYYKGRRGEVHVFQKNNEMAGYCGVQHALQLRGIDGYFGPPRRAAILGFGSVGRGAVLALKSHGIHDITVFTRRPVFLVGNQIPGIRYKQFFVNRSGGLVTESPDGDTMPLVDLLSHADILVNCILQNPKEPIVFIQNADILKFKKECLVIDISCDAGMGFQFAHPTSFSQPICRFGNIFYYSIDHTPSLLWDSASWEISLSLLPYLQDFIMRRKNPVLDDATDMKNGVIQNKTILAFQKRSPVYPYRRRENVLTDGGNSDNESSRKAGAC